MKSRSGFVSNSSTTSFLIYGAELEGDDVAKFEAFTRDEKREFGLEHHYTSWESEVIGLSWDAMHDDETMAQFRARVKAKIEEVLGHEVDCGFHEDAYFDG